MAGGASGLGEATARALHADGRQRRDRRPERGSGAGLAEELGAGAVHRADVTDPDEVQAAAQAAAALDGGLRISVCCAGIGWAERVASRRGPHSLEPFETVIRVNLIGTFNVLRFAAAAMVEHEPMALGRAGRLHQHRVDRRVRRPDRPDLLLGVKGRDRRNDVAGGP